MWRFRVKCGSADTGKNSGEYKARPHITLLEYDDRFGVFKEFVKYDFQHAIKLPAELKGSFDRIIVDPPFLSEDCQTKGEHTLDSRNKVILTKFSCTDRTMAGQIVDSIRSVKQVGLFPVDLMHRRAHGGIDHAEALQQSGHKDHNL